LQSARTLLTQIRGDQSARPWQITDAELLVRTLEIATGLTDSAQDGLAGAGCLTSVIEEHYERGAYDLAAEEAVRQLDIRRKFLGESSPDAVESMAALSANLWKQGRYAKGEVVARENLDVCLRLYGDRHPQVGESLNMLGLLLMAQGKYDEAGVSYRRALELFQDVMGEENVKVSMCLNNIGALYGELFDGVNSEAYYRAALDMNRRLLGDDHPTVARNLHNLGSVLYGQGDLLRAEQYLNEALAKRRRNLGSDHPDVATSAHMLAEVSTSLGDLESAHSLYGEALAVRRASLGDQHPHVAWNLHNLANLHFLGGDYELAERYAKKALAIRRHMSTENPDAARSLRLLAAIVQARGDYQAAEEMYAEAVAMSRKIYGHDDYATLIAMASLYAERGDHVRAESLLTVASHEYEAVRLRASGVRTRARWSRSSPYDRLAGERLVLGDTARAWPAVEMALGRGLVDMLADAETQRGQAANQDAYSLKQGNVYSLALVQSLLEQNEAIVGWLDANLSRNQPVAWVYVIRNSGPVRWSRVSTADPDRGHGKTIAQTPDHFRELLRFTASWPSRVTDTDRIMTEAHALFTERLAPIIRHLDGVTDLVVIPSRAMLGIPLEALADETGMLVGRRYAVSYASSATAYAWLRNRRSADGVSVASRMLLVGDPPFSPDHRDQMERESADAAPVVAMGQSGSMSVHDLTVLRSALAGNPEALGSLPRLRHTREEVHEVGSLVEEATVLLGPEASEDAIAQMARSGELGRFDAIHFATHALVDDRYPERSALVLSRVDLPDPVDEPMSGGPVSDGLVRAEEIARDWVLDAELVTLSGCRTALGRNQVGEGYVGFAHAFYRAGGRSLLVSLWDVDDAATALLMRRFYENLTGRYEGERAGRRGEPMSKSQALQEAKEWLRTYTDETGTRMFAHPAYWSAFILIGDSS
jgi:CHAT domain-containing protein/Tfp pilus assembly protein PilF